MKKDKLIIGIYKRLAKKNGREPTVGDLTHIGVNRNMIRYYFGNITTLRQMAGELPGIKTQRTELEVIYKLLGAKNEK